MSNEREVIIFSLGKKYRTIPEIEVYENSYKGIQGLTHFFQMAINQFKTDNGITSGDNAKVLNMYRADEDNAKFYMANVTGKRIKPFMKLLIECSTMEEFLYMMIDINSENVTEFKGDIIC